MGSLECLSEMVDVPVPVTWAVLREHQLPLTPLSVDVCLLMVFGENLSKIII
jgi:hypothetical protein